MAPAARRESFDVRLRLLHVGPTTPNTANAAGLILVAQRRPLEFDALRQKRVRERDARDGFEELPIGG